MKKIKSFSSWEFYALWPAGSSNHDVHPHGGGLSANLICGVFPFQDRAEK